MLVIEGHVHGPHPLILDLCASWRPYFNTAPRGSKDLVHTSLY